MWNQFERICINKADEYLGRTKSKKGPIKESKWWNKEVKEAVRAKKDTFKLWQSTKNESDLENYRKMKKNAKREVAISRSQTDFDFYEQLELAKSEVDVHKIAKLRHNNTKDIKNVKYINDSNSKLLTNDKEITNRWSEYYKHLLNVSHPRNRNYNGPEIVEGPVPNVALEEIKEAIKQMKIKHQGRTKYQQKYGSTWEMMA